MPLLDDDISKELAAIEGLKNSPFYDENAALQIKRTEVVVRIRRAYVLSAKRRLRLGTFVAHYLNSDTRAASETPPPPTRAAFLEHFEGNAVASVEFVFEMVFIQLVASVEYFLFDALRCVLSVYPESLSSSQVPLGDVISKSRQEVIDSAVERYLNDLSYKRPEEYVKEISKALRISSDQSNDLWKRFFEIKARRDLAAHNDWIVNEQYLRKASPHLRGALNPGERLRVDFEYFKASSNVCEELEKTIVEALRLAWK